MASRWGVSPRQSVQAECRRRGSDPVVAGCLELLAGSAIDEDLVIVLAGPAARQVLEGGEGGPNGYWPRVWALRGLLYAWSDIAAPAVVQATHDSSWRVREMAAKVIRRHVVDDGLEAVIRLQSDAVERVRLAAVKATESLVSYQKPGQLSV
jgi:HEAT repeat protein